MKIKAETKENILAVILGFLGLVFVVTFVGTVFSQEPEIKPIHVYVINSTEN